VGTVYGAGSSIVNGDIKKLWDNDFLTKVDAVDQGLDNIFKVYNQAIPKIRISYKECFFIHYNLLMILLKLFFYSRGYFN